MLDFDHLVTADGYDYRVLASDLPGPFPIAIFCNGEIRRLTAEGQSRDGEAYNLVEKRVTHTRFVNLYRAADGSFCFGSQSYKSNDERWQKNDTQRAIYGLKITLDESSRSVSAELV
jgi:hypothetical protein